MEFASRPAPGAVHAYHAHVDVLDRDATAYARALGWLTAPERDRHGRFRADVDRRMFLLGRVMARTLVGRALGTDPGAWQWGEGAHGRPEIAAPATSLRFNLSHSAGLVVCALAEGRDVGVDVEHLGRRPMDPGLVHRYCSAAEAADILARGDGWQARFLVYWTLKEAYLKARGVGVSVPLSDVSFSPDPDDIRVTFCGTLADAETGWVFALAQPTADHLIAVAAAAGPDERPAIGVTAMPAGLLP